MPVLWFQHVCIKYDNNALVSVAYVQGVVNAAALIPVTVSIHQMLIVLEDIELMKAITASSALTSNNVSPSP